MFPDPEKADQAKSAYVAGKIDTTAHPIVRPDMLNSHTPDAPKETTQPRLRVITGKSRAVDPFAQSIPGVALFDGAFSGEVPAVLLPADEAAPVREELGLGKRILNWRTLVPLVIIVVIFGFAVKNLVAGFNLREISGAITRANLAYVAVAFVVYYLSFAVRVLRWRMLLTNVGIAHDPGTRLPGFGKLFEILYLSWFANSVVPAKLGDVYRAYLLKRDANVSGTRSFGTVLAERLLDFIVLLLLFVGVALVNFKQISAGLQPQFRATLQLGLIAVFALIVVGIGALVALRIWREPIRRRVPPRFQTKYDDFQVGTLGSFRRLPLLLAMTALVWFCEAARFFFVAQSINLLPTSAFFAAMFVALGEALLTVVPFTSGGIGIVEAGMLAMLLVFVHGPNAQNNSAAAIVLDRLINLGSVLVFGGLLYLVVFVRDARKPAAVPQPTQRA